MPSATDSRAESRAAAEKLKAEGNVAYQKQKWGAAVDVSSLFSLPCRMKVLCIRPVLTQHVHISSSVVTCTIFGLNKSGTVDLPHHGAAFLSTSPLHKICASHWATLC